MTERLELRHFEPTDLDALAGVFAKYEVWKFPYNRPWRRDETATFIANQRSHWETCEFGLWLAILQSTGGVIGYVGLSVPMFLPEILPAVEVGWRFDPDAWGRGYATEAARAALAEGFTTLGFDEICSLPQVENVASVRVAERLGMRNEGIATIAANERFGEKNAVLFWMTADEWRAS
ncbi:MAG: GNAT family N-acetyltransferase [Acidimicrobiia bacterium]|nr:GNAT family N-acetyltransferase [Acidimicrobiia bacterium]